MARTSTICMRADAPKVREDQASFTTAVAVTTVEAVSSTICSPFLGLGIPTEPWRLRPILVSTCKTPVRTHMRKWTVLWSIRVNSG